MNNIIPFDFKKHAVRVVVDGNNEPWFVAKDIAEILGYSDAHKMTSKLDDDEKSNRQISGLGTETGGRGITLINESGLYSCVLTSKKSEAKPFKKWLTSEVLPSIRKTGGYSVQPAIDLNNPEILRSLLLGHVEENIAMKAEIKVLAPQVEALHRISGSEGSLCVTDSAKALGMQPKKLFEWLNQNDWIYKRAGGKHWIGHSRRIKSGLVDHKVTVVKKPDGTEKVVEQVLITPKGLTKLAVVAL